MKKLEAERDWEMVLKNRLSWSKYNTNRLEQTFETAEGAEKRQPAPQKHGVKRDRLNIDTQGLFEEASKWTADSDINWTQLAIKYGLKQKKF